ncbi:MAG: nucleotidyltransferase [Verrucomicrobia bacterium]|nr:nucleotidyltransferase [Verrucomicrobiota bacterium]MBU1857173.1 nucleotidyltransferase [Verrucomicrobiota bacterium]
MADIQKHFERFHAIIRIDYEMSQPLREKRDIILDRIRKHLKDNGRPGFDEFLQGSYAMKTGVVPIEELEYDIDVGLRFSFSEKKHTAADVRQWIFEAVDGHTETVNERGPCVRVTYVDGYHVDLVSYAVWDDTLGITQFRLAHKKNGWRPADPPKLIEHVDGAMKPYAGTEDGTTSTNQFRRVVRYLRRWYDEAIPEESEAKPTGLAYVLAAVQYLRPTQTWNSKPNDLLAVQNLATVLSLLPGRIVVKKPTPEYDDLFARLSDGDMNDFKARLVALALDLGSAGRETDPVKACKLAKKHFGRDFPVPEPEETAKKTAAPAIVTSSSSASR